MKLVCSKSDLLNGVQIVSKAVPSKTTMSILECILVDASKGMIKLTANDTELGIDTIIDGQIVEKGIVALDAKIFLEIIRKLPDNDITVKKHSLLLLENQEKIFLIYRLLKKIILLSFHSLH